MINKQDRGQYQYGPNDESCRHAKQGGDDRTEDNCAYAFQKLHGLNIHHLSSPLTRFPTRPP